MKNRKMSIRLSDVHLTKIHDKAQQANMSLTDYVVACCLEKPIIIIDGLEEVIRQQKALGRNLNQLTALANMGRIKTVYLDDVVRKYAAVNESLSALIRKKV